MPNSPGRKRVTTGHPMRDIQNQIQKEKALLRQYNQDISKMKAKIEVYEQEEQLTQLADLFETAGAGNRKLAERWANIYLDQHQDDEAVNVSAESIHGFIEEFDLQVREADPVEDLMPVRETTYDLSNSSDLARALKDDPGFLAEKIATGELKPPEGFREVLAERLAEENENPDFFTDENDG